MEREHNIAQDQIKDEQISAFDNLLRFLFLDRSSSLGGSLKHDNQPGGLARRGIRKLIETSVSAVKHIDVSDMSDE